MAGTRITTPPVGAYRHPAGYHGLRIEANPHSTPVLPGRSDVGMAATPMGKMAEEFKYFCPLCMMFYKDIREMPCCKQYTCTFCLADFLHTKQHSPPAVATGAEASPPPHPQVCTPPLNGYISVSPRNRNLPNAPNVFGKLLWLTMVPVVVIVVIVVVVECGHWSSSHQML